MTKKERNTFIEELRAEITENRSIMANVAVETAELGIDLAEAIYREAKALQQVNEATDLIVYLEEKVRQLDGIVALLRDMVKGHQTESNQDEN